MTTEPAIEQPLAQPGPAEGPQLELSAEYLAEFQARVDQLVTEDDTPVDTIFSEKQMRLLTEPLYSSWQGPGAQRSFVVLANVGVFPSINEPPVVPDVLLSLDVRLRALLTEKRNCTYLLWEIGKAPDVVIEIVSNRVGGEFSDKLASFCTDACHLLCRVRPGAILAAQIPAPVCATPPRLRRAREPVATRDRPGPVHLARHLRGLRGRVDTLVLRRRHACADRGRTRRAGPRTRRAAGRTTTRLRARTRGVTP